MKRIILILLSGILIGTLASCGQSVSKEEYDRLSKELEESKARVESLAKELSDAKEAGGKVVAYAALLDLLLYPLFVSEALPTRFQFDKGADWQQKLRDGVQLFKDQGLSDYVSKLEKNEASLAQVIDYIINKILENIPPLS